MRTRAAPKAHVLVLGGVREGREAAAALAGMGHEVTYALAGVTAAPRLPHGARARLGGFGGAEGLARWMAGRDVRLLVDATHPFAARMGWNAHEAAGIANVPLVRLERPAWKPERGDVWLDAPSIEAAAEMLPHGARVFAALGARGLAKLAGRGDLWLCGRSLSRPEFAVPPRWRLWRGGPGRNAAGEAALLRAVRAQLIVCRNSGGAAGRGRLLAARALGLPVIMIARPERPRAQSVQSVEKLIQITRASLA